MNVMVRKLSLRVLDAAAASFDAELQQLIAFEVAQDADVDSTVASIIADVRARGRRGELETRHGGAVHDADVDGGRGVHHAGARLGIDQRQEQRGERREP